jgi:hypothetical protein
MARLGTFDLNANPPTWWDETAVPAGWYTNEDVPDPTFINPSFPHTTARPYLGASSEQFTTELAPTPEGQLPSDWQPSYPDRSLSLALARAAAPFEAFAPAPERSAPLASVVHPDRIAAMGASAMQAVAFVPIVSSSVFLNWSASYPDITARQPSVSASTSAGPVSPERTSPLAVVTYPDTTTRPALAAASTPASVLPVAPERTSPVAWTFYPDALPRLLMPASWVVVPPRPEGELALDWQPEYPDRATAFALARSALPFIAYAPAPERTSPAAAAIFPDATNRLSLAGASMPAWAAPTALERPAPLAWSSWPDSIYRTSLAPASQLAGTEIAPRPDRTSTLAWSFWPDRVDRQAYATHEQAFVTGLSPLPIPNTATPIGVGAWWPDSTWARSLPPGALQSLALAPSPLPDTPLRWQPHWPDATSALWRTAANRQPFASPVAPERTATLASASYPDSPPRSASPVAWVSMPSSIERSSPLAWASFPDVLPRAALPPTWAAKPTALERTTSLAATAFPDAIASPARPQQQHSVLWPLPLPSVVTGWSAEYPDAIRGPKTLLYEQPSTARNTVPERSTPSAAASYPDSLPRRVLAPSWFVADVRPERSAPLAVSSFPDSLLRLLPLEHQVSALWPLPPISLITGWWPSFPDSVRRPQEPQSSFWAFPVLGYAPVLIGGGIANDAPLLVGASGDVTLLTGAAFDAVLLVGRASDVALLTGAPADVPLLVGAANDKEPI